MTFGERLPVPRVGPEAPDLVPDRDQAACAAPRPAPLPRPQVLPGSRPAGGQGRRFRPLCVRPSPAGGERQHSASDKRGAHEGGVPRPIGSVLDTLGHRSRGPGRALACPAPRGGEGELCGTGEVPAWSTAASVLPSVRNDGADGPAPGCRRRRSSEPRMSDCPAGRHAASAASQQSRVTGRFLGAPGGRLGGRGAWGVTQLRALPPPLPPVSLHTPNTQTCGNSCVPRCCTRLTRRRGRSLSVTLFSVGPGVRDGLGEGPAPGHCSGGAVSEKPVRGGRRGRSAP